ncbi:MAG: respiratory nitrate reductase subunit gamma [Gammaproteobacteria bacterium]|nr:respiratory nitrate reductase subunit gamma [Gammaproteobacteria bacterium]MDH5652344.1 respiratory nitrate reductase subunit gamma [Gammaproteobacteria bacterium]
MTALSYFFVFLFYAATAVFVIGVARKIMQYARTPAPLKIPTTPAPVTQTGVVFRMAREVVLFSSLFKSNKWTWVFGWMFHFALLLAFVRHLRYAISSDNILWPLINNSLVLAAGQYGALAMLLGLTGLFGRRIFVDRVRYISAPSDYLMLILIFAIATTGAMMSFVTHTDIVQLKSFVLGLIWFNWQPLPNDGLLITHLALVALLMLIFPISKLLHAPGLFFSPTRNQVDNPREKRHISPWGQAIDDAEAKAKA